MLRALAFTLVFMVGVFASAGCSSPEQLDAPPGLDAPTRDAAGDARVDVSGDTPTLVDGGDAGLDSGTFDTGGLDAPGVDAPGLDAPGVDAPGLDAPGVDAPGLDAPGVDAGPDAPGVDAPGLDAPGVDAPTVDGGPITTCSIGVSPATGTTTDTFTFSANSNGTTCTAILDGSLMLSVPCTSMMSFPGSTFGVGPHTVVLQVAAGPSGATSCSTSFTVTDVPPTTTCSITVTPPAGTTADSFLVSASSNGTACSVRLDGGPPLSTPCMASMSLLGSFLGVGTHALELSVGGGPSGPTTCSTMVTVRPATSGTSCTISVTPESGPVGTVFLATFASDGTGCTLSVDGLMVATVPCVGTFSSAGFAIPVGPHTATLNVAAGPGGATSCNDMFTVTGP